MPQPPGDLQPKPHGGRLVDLMASDERVRELRRESLDWPSWQLTPRQLCDLELLMNGGFSPLVGFMVEQDFRSVCENQRLADGTLWPLPVTLDVSAELADRLDPGDRLALRDPEGVMLAALQVESLFSLDPEQRAQAVYATLDRRHPGVARLLERTNRICVGGAVEGLVSPSHFDFNDLRLDPRGLRRRFQDLGCERIVAFQTRNPMHRAHVELTQRAQRELDAHLLIHPAVGPTRPGDVDPFTRIRCYRAVLNRYPSDTATLALLPLAMRMAGPREALLHAIIRKNYGCTHLIVGRDHAGPGVGSDGRPFYGPYDAQELVERHQDELGLEMVPFRQMTYVPDRKAYLPADEIPEGTQTLSISGSELRRRLSRGDELPDWLTYPQVAAELRRTFRPRHQKGFTVFFTGLSGAGKSTVANVLRIKLLELGGRPVTLLDGDIVRQNLSSELGFSKEHRDLNIRRIAFVAHEITKNGGIAICAPIAPYAAARRQARESIEPGGGFVLVHVDTPIETCEKRDRKGLYAKARAGLIPDFTGISDPYEAPADAEVTLDTTELTPLDAAGRVLAYLEREGYIESVG